MKTLRQDVAIIGIGGAGTNIAYLFEQRGYNVIQINSSHQDLEAVKSSRNIRHLKGFNGCAGDRALAEKALAENAELIDELCNLEEQILLICYASGGGTGSGVGVALAGILAEETDKTICSMVVLPGRDEEYGNHINALKCSQELVQTEGLGAVMFLDNSCGSKKEINYLAVQNMDTFLTDTSVSDKGNVDEQERRLLLSAPGSMILSVLGREKTKNELVQESLTTKKIYAALQGDGQCEYIAIINALNPGIRKEIVQEIVGLPRRTFTGWGGKKNIIAISGLSYPINHLNQLRALAKEQADTRRLLAEKAKEVKLEDLDFDEEPVLPQAKEHKIADAPKPSKRELLMKLSKGN